MVPYYQIIQVYRGDDLQAILERIKDKPNKVVIEIEAGNYQGLALKSGTTIEVK